MNKPVVPIPERDHDEFSRDALVNERSHRREKAWQIFAWASTLLTATIAGVIGLSSNEHFDLQRDHRLLITAATLTIWVYSTKWIVRNLDLEESATDSIKLIDDRLNIPEVKTKTKQEIGYPLTFFLLTLGALTTIWFSPE